MPLAQKRGSLGLSFLRALGVEAGDLARSLATTLPRTPRCSLSETVWGNCQGKLSKQGLPGSFLALPPTPPTSLGNLGHQFLIQKVGIKQCQRQEGIARINEIP